MSFVRTAKRENPFVQLDKYFLEDSNLSWDATGLLTYILSKPDNWQVRKTDLLKRKKNGKEKVESAMLELMANGYMNWSQEKDENGLFSDWIYEVYERPEFNPNAEACMIEGAKRIEERKNRNKKKNSKKAPKVGNPVPGETIPPKVGYPLSDNPPSDNPPYSNKDFKDIDFSNKKKEEEEEAKVNYLVNFYSNNISDKGIQIIKNALIDWCNLLPYEIVKTELENCALYGAKSWKYVDSVLKEDQRLNITTISDLELKYSKHEEKKNKGQKSVGNKADKTKKNSVPTRTELLPNWFDKPQEKIDPEEQKRLDEEYKQSPAYLQIQERIANLRK